MTVEVVNNGGDTTATTAATSFFLNGDLKSNPNNKKSKENERRRRRRKQKKKKKNNSSSQLEKDDDDGNDSDSHEANGGFANGDNQAVEDVEVKYVPEKADLDDDLLFDFKKVFEKFSFKEPEGDEEDEKKDETDQDAAGKKKADSDSDEEEQDNQQKEKGISNKKKKLQRRMKIAELKTICRRPDVVEIWDATAHDPKLLVFLKSYRNTVPVPRHWCQKRKYLQGIGCDIHGGQMGRFLPKGTIEWFSINVSGSVGWDIEHD